MCRYPAGIGFLLRFSSLHLSVGGWVGMCVWGGAGGAGFDVAADQIGTHLW